MKKNIILLALLTASISCLAKDIKILIVTTNPQMHCENCEKRIKNNLRFEKGVKKIETDIPNQTVTITYDAEKTTPEQIIDSFKKFKYTAQPVKKDEKKTATPQPANKK
jgi:copper chaperone CopZ